MTTRKDSARLEKEIFKSREFTEVLAAHTNQSLEVLAFVSAPRRQEATKPRWIQSRGWYLLWLHEGHSILILSPSRC